MYGATYACNLNIVIKSRHVIVDEVDDVAPDVTTEP